VAHIKPSEERGCTDILFLIGFIASWLLMFFLLGYTIEQGANPNFVIRGVDWTGTVCGDTGHEDYPFAAWPDPYSGYPVKVCLKNCTDTKDWDFTVKYETIEFGDAYCIPTGPFDENVTDFNLTSAGLDEDEFNAAKSAATRAMGDMLVAWPIILASGGIALAMSFVYTIITQRCGCCLVGSLVGSIAIAGFLAGYAILDDLYSRKDEPVLSTFTASSLKAQEAIGWAFVIVTFIFLIVMFALRKQILLAVEVIGEAAKAMRDLPWLVCFPVFPFVVGLGYIAMWVSVSIFIFSVTDPEQMDMSELAFNVESSDFPEPYKSIIEATYGNGSLAVSYLDYEFGRLDGVVTDEYMPTIENYTGNYTELIWRESLFDAFVFNLFHLFWVVQFIIYLTYLVFAGAVAEWYFSTTDDKGKKEIGAQGDKLSPTPCRDSFYRTCRFHLGSIAFGSFIIAVIQLIRAAVHYIQYQVQEKNNKVQAAIFCCIHCCLKCVECCCDKINKQGYVWIAIWGDNFMTATCAAFKLVWANLLRIAALNLVGDYMLLIGKFLVSLATAGVTAFLLTGVYGDRLSSIMMPTFAAFVIAYMVACFFMALFEVTIDTIFLCFLIDEKCNKASGRMFASQSLQDLVIKYEKKSFEEAKKMHAPGTDVEMDSMNKGNVSSTKVETA
jgi:hypothetical protein